MPVYCKYVAPGNVADYRPGADRATGQVQLIGTRVTIVSKAIDFSDKPLGTVSLEGIWDVPQAVGSTIAAGSLVYWDDNGDPVGGTAGTGAFTTTAGGNNLAGVATPEQPNGTATTAATDQFVRIKLAGMSINVGTVAGSMTADDITGSDAALSITGIAGAGAGAGGTVPITGGVGHTNGAGGAAGVTGGAGAGTGAGGAVNLTGGASGDGATGNGGAAAVAGGAAASVNGAGGAASVTGGAGRGTGNGGAASLVGGASGAGATGNGGAVSITGGAASSTNGNGGSIVLTPGALAGSGVNGMIRTVGREASRVTVHAETVAATLTIAELLHGIITGTHTEGATQAYTLPTGTLMSAGCACADGDGFEWSLINLSANAADTITVTGAADHDIVGVAVVASAHADSGSHATGLGINSSRWYSRKTSGNTWVTYRIG